MSNFRAFMSDDEEEFEQKLAEVSKPKPKSKAPVKAPAVVPATTPAAVATPGPKGPRRGPKPKPNVMEPSAVADNADLKHERPARGRGGYKGPRSGDRDDRGKRFFDRHSGAPGSGKDPKKHGAGGHNWGQPLNTNVAIDAAEAEALAPVGAAAEKKIEEVPAAGEGEPARVETPKEGEAPEGEVAPEEPKEPEVPTYTFEEFLAKKAEKRAGLGFENLRESKIEEVKEGRAYTKKDKAVVNDEEVFIALGEKKAAEERKKNQKGKQVLTDIGFRVKDPERPGSFRGGREGAPRGRGGFRGGARGGRGGFRGGRGGASSAQVRVDDQQNFPELGA